MTNEKALLDQIRKKHLPPLIGTSLVTIVIIMALVLAAFGHSSQNIIEIIFGIVLVAFIAGSAVYIELYQFLNPQKDIFFRKYGKPAEAAAIVSDALSEQKIYSDEKLVITEHYIYCPNDYTTLLKIDDVRLAYESYGKDGKKEFVAVEIIDAWGIKQLIKYKIKDVSAVREAIAAIRENFSNVKIRSDENAIAYVRENLKKLND